VRQTYFHTTIGKTGFHNRIIFWALRRL